MYFSIMKKITILFLTIALAFGLVGPALAKTTPPPAPVKKAIHKVVKKVVKKAVVVKKKKPVVKAKPVVVKNHGLNLSAIPKGATRDYAAAIEQARQDYMTAKSKAHSKADLQQAEDNYSQAVQDAANLLGQVVPVPVAGASSSSNIITSSTTNTSSAGNW